MGIFDKFLEESPEEQRIKKRASEGIAQYEKDTGRKFEPEPGIESEQILKEHKEAAARNARKAGAPEGVVRAGEAIGKLIPENVEDAVPTSFMRKAAGMAAMGGVAALGKGFLKGEAEQGAKALARGGEKRLVSKLAEKGAPAAEKELTKMGDVGIKEGEERVLDYASHKSPAEIESARKRAKVKPTEFVYVGGKPVEVK